MTAERLVSEALEMHIPIRAFVAERYIEGKRPSGMDKGLFTVPDDFDEESDMINEMFES